LAIAKEITSNKRNLPLITGINTALSLPICENWCNLWLTYFGVAKKYPVTKLPIKKYSIHPSFSSQYLNLFKNTAYN
jgi:hypothetical protein